jgi:hypothetical protein
VSCKSDDMMSGRSPELEDIIPDDLCDDVRLLNLLNVGAELVGEPFSPVPIDSWVRLTESQEALALALDDETLTFYRSLLRTAG